MMFGFLQKAPPTLQMYDLWSLEKMPFNSAEEVTSVKEKTRC